MKSGMKHSLRLSTPRSGPATHPGPARSGFTLIEILVTLTILSILIGLLFTALGPAQRTARVAEVKSDMEKLKSAITAFKLEFQGSDLPGSLTLSETGDWSVGLNADLPRSRAELRKVFPDYGFGATDFNGDGDATDLHTLSGAECLVFFLGGMRNPTSGALDSFSKNPVAPFNPGGSRYPTFYDFGVSGFDNSTSRWTGRLVDLDNDGFPELLDPIPGQLKPYLYFSTYGGRGYRSTAGNPAHPDLTVAPAWFNPENYSPASPANGMPYPYYRTWAAGSVTASDAYSKKSYQIISAGFDFVYGVGGTFNPDTATSLMSAGDRDNIVDFHPGTLGE